MARRLSTVPGVALIALAAVMWGLDGLIRKPLSDSTTATTIVFGEHVVLVALTLPLIVPALYALGRAGVPYVLAGVAIGAGASAVATILLTQALATSHYDLITIYVLQKSQPLIAITGAWLVLGEQPRRGFVWFVLPALAGLWLAALPHPLDPHAHGLVPIAETLGAAVLWGLGTVFGRFLGRKLAFEHVTTVRFAFGLAASACALPIMGASAYAGAQDSFWIAVRALVTGLVALGLYYYGLRRTPAMLAAIGELAFPIVAVLVGIYVFDNTLHWTQWLGIAITVTVVTLLPARRRAPLVEVPPADAAFAPASA
jgi:drug/metabolite transporter (DMT)-like permease